MYRNPVLPSLLRRIGLSSLLGFGFFVLGAALQALLGRFGIHGWMAYADDLFVAVLAGLLAFIYEQRRHKAMREKLEVIAAMNHHVRNALQAITFSPYAAHTRQIELIEGAARRIQWALDEVLPGEPQTHDVPAEGSLGR